MTWFIHSGSGQEGPFSIEELKAKVSEGKISGEAHVWKQGMPAWAKLSEVSELATILSAPVPPVFAAPLPSKNTSSVRVDELSVFMELPKTAAEAPREIPRAHAGKFKKEAIKAQTIARRTETLKTSRQLLPRLAFALAAFCVILGGVIAFFSFSQRELSPIPGISEADFARLKAAALSESDVTKVEMAASTDDPLHPRIHIASNLSNGTRFALTFRGVPGTLLRPVTQAPTLQTSQQKQYHAMTDRFELPKGQYHVEATVQGENKVLASGTFFLGGQKDAEYETVIAQARAKRREKAEVELRSINEAVSLLSAFQETLVVFGSEIGPGKQPEKAKIQDTQRKWDELEGSLPQKSIIWQSGSENDFVLGKLVGMARQAWQHAKKADQLYIEYFSKAGVSDAELGKMQEAINAELNKARDVTVSLKSEIDKTLVQEL